MNSKFNVDSYIDEFEKASFLDFFKQHMVDKKMMLEEDDIYDFVSKNVFVIDGEVRVIVPDYELERVKNR